MREKEPLFLATVVAVDRDRRAVELSGLVLAERPFGDANPVVVGRLLEPFLPQDRDEESVQVQSRAPGTSRVGQEDPLVVLRGMTDAGDGDVDLRA